MTVDRQQPIQPPIDNGPSHRRGFSYRLRSLLLFVAVVSIIMAWVAHERRQSRRELDVAERLQANGASIEFVGLFDARRENPFDPPVEQSWWRATLGDILGPRVRGVGIRIEQPSDLNWMAEFECLEVLGLDALSVSDLAPLAELKQLRILSVGNGVQIHDLSPLEGLANLEELWLSFAQVSDLSPLANLKNLQHLELGGSKVADLTPLAGLKNLRILGLNSTPVNDLSPLAGLEKLQYLSLCSTDVSITSLQASLPNCRIDR